MAGTVALKAPVLFQVGDGFTTQVITSFGELKAFGPEWREFEMRCQVDLPFQTWEWATAWWRHLRADGPIVRDSLRVCLVRRTSGQLVGIAPFVLTERPRIGPLRLRSVHFIGADPNITELRSMLCLPGFEEECYRVMLERLAASAQDWDWIEWDGVPPLIGGMVGLLDVLSHVSEKSSFIVALKPSWGEFRKPLGRNIKESLRKCYNSLRRDGLTYRLYVVVEENEIEAALEDFFRLHTRRAHQQSAVPHRDVFVHPPSRAFLIDVCRQLSQRGVARVFQLWVDDRLVATRIGFVLSDMLYLYYSGWDPDYSRYSVMTTLQAEAIKYAIAQRLERVHLSTGADVSKTRWGPSEVRLLSGRQLSPHRRARAVQGLYEQVARVQGNKVARALMPGFLARRANFPTTDARRRGGAE